MGRSFNADQMTTDLLEAPVTIGGKTFKPARLTPDVRREQLRIATKGAKVARAAGFRNVTEQDEDLTEEQIDQRVEAVGEIDEGIYLQLAVLLRDEANKPPTPVFLAKHLDNRVAQKLLAWLLEDEQPGEAVNGTTPVATSP